MRTAVKRVAHAGSWAGRPAHRRPGAMLPAFLICGGAALRHHVAVPGAGRGTRPCSRRCCTRACTTSTPTTTGAAAGTGRTSRCSAPPRRSSAGTACAPQTFESSPYYMFHPLAAERIARDLPGVKLIVLVRDPVERAYSQHAHELARGFETEPTSSGRSPWRTGPAGRRGRAAAGRPGLPTASRTSTTPTSPAASTSTTCDRLASCSAATGCTWSTATDSSPTPSRSTTACWTSSACRTLGYPRFEQHNARPRARRCRRLRRAAATSTSPRTTSGWPRGSARTRQLAPVRPMGRPRTTRSLLVTGLPRSGTSWVGKMLAAGGRGRLRQRAAQPAAPAGPLPRRAGRPGHPPVPVHQPGRRPSRGARLRETRGAALRLRAELRPNRSATTWPGWPGTAPRSRRPAAGPAGDARRPVRRLLDRLAGARGWAAEAVVLVRDPVCVRRPAGGRWAGPSTSTSCSSSRARPRPPRGAAAARPRPRTRSRSPPRCGPVAREVAAAARRRPHRRPARPLRGPRPRSRSAATATCTPGAACPGPRGPPSASAGPAPAPPRRTGRSGASGCPVPRSARWTRPRTSPPTGTGSPRTRSPGSRSSCTS